MRPGAVADLAVFGGPPLLERPAHVGAPNVPDPARVTALIAGALERRWLTNDGPLVRAFEERLREAHGVRHAVTTSSGTLALMLMIRALGLTGSVVVPALTFVATAHALLWQGVTPAFCDVDPETWTLDPARVAEAVRPDTSGVLGVHLWGHLCDVDGLAAAARRRGVRLAFDAAHAVGSSRDGRPVGGFGDAEALSFHATKVLNTFEGGAVMTDDDDLAERLTLMRNFGFADVDQVVSAGINAKMSEAHAAMGLASLEELPGFLAANAANMTAYRRGLDGAPGIRLRRAPAGGRSNDHHVVIEVDAASTGLSRDALLELLTAENVLARRYFFPGCHRMEPYRSLWPEAGERLPVTERLLERVLCLPTGTAMDPDTAGRICELIRFACERAEEVAARLAARGGGHPVGERA
jgi:dTDP-4-amino-4,6-dideoxygalactose transaminase